MKYKFNAFCQFFPLCCFIGKDRLFNLPVLSTIIRQITTTDLSGFGNHQETSLKIRESFNIFVSNRQSVVLLDLCATNNERLKAEIIELVLPPFTKLMKCKHGADETVKSHALDSNEAPRHKALKSE